MTLPDGWPQGITAILDISGKTRVLPVHINNPNDFAVRVGLRGSSCAEDFIIHGNNAKTTHVPAGKYSVYFQFSYDPKSVYQGSDFTMTDRGIEITITKIIDGNFEIRKIK